uniref:Coiled-coil domain-containing protein n=1 Tax=Ananas comosus var. bracteatus TaxID=296719 RepID=A0A6V7PWA9_ANACO|nr:unnamed protein product [Ananas comosus var. bracteatus]
MPKKMGTNTKAEAARERRSAAEAERQEREAREKEDQLWRDAEGPKSRAARRREGDTEKRAEAASRRAENRRLAELEQQELDRAARRPDPKASRVSLLRRREEERLRLEREAEAAKKRRSRTADEEEYERVVLVSNTNRDDSVIEAHTVEDAIAGMALAEPPLPPDRHPERRLKASFKAFEEAELPKLKEEKPGLTLNQYKDMVWKLWKKSPDNPLNQVVE